jgi:hypothetical protein
LIAGEIALTHQERTFEECEIHFEEELEILSRFFHQWRLRPNSSKTEVCVFHLGTHDANRKLTVQFGNTLITHVDHPNYLEMTLDRTLSYKPHLEKTGLKMNSRSILVQKLSDTNGYTLQTSGKALVYSAAEYYVPVWLNSIHVNKAYTSN